MYGRVFCPSHLCMRACVYVRARACVRACVCGHILKGKGPFVSCVCVSMSRNHVWRPQIIAAAGISRHHQRAISDRTHHTRILPCFDLSNVWSVAMKSVRVHRHEDMHLNVCNGNSPSALLHTTCTHIHTQLLARTREITHLMMAHARTGTIPVRRSDVLTVQINLRAGQ